MISVIIVAYNSESTIKDCVQSVVNTIKKNDFEIIISDNSQNDDTKDALEEFLNAKSILINYFKNDDNLGFAKANNKAVKKSKGEFVLFLNPDTKVYEKTIDGIVDFIKKNPDCGVATCYVELLNGKLDDSSHRGFPTPFRSFSHFTGLSKAFPKSKIFGGYQMTYLDLSKTHEIDSAAGSFMMVARKVGDKIGWWDEDYFFYGEDIDFCFQVKKIGYKVYFVPEYRALHLKGISSGIKKVSRKMTKATEETKKNATYHRFRAMEIFYDKNYKSKYPKAVTLFVKLGIELKKTIS